jgi:hypothetical protein
MPNNDFSVTGGVNADVSEPFALQSAVPEVTYDFDDAEPPWECYLGVNDRLLLQNWASVVGVVVTFNVLLLRPDNQVVPFKYTMVSVADFNEHNIVVQVAEGYILSASMTIGTQLGNRQYVWGCMSLARAPFTDQDAYRTLCQGSLNKFTGMSFPAMPPTRFVDGAGNLSSYTQNNPAAGADFIYSVPGNVRQRLQSLSCTFTASAVAGNRLVNFIIDDGATVVANIPTGITVVASGMNVFTLGDSLLQTAAFNGASTAASPSNLLLRAGWRIRSSTGGILAGDQWSGIQLAMQDWIEPQ